MDEKDFFPFATPVENSKFIPSVIPKLLNLNQEHPLKQWFLWSNPYKIDVIITSLIEMLELPKFDHITTSAIKFKSDDNILPVTSWAKILTS